MRRFEEVEEEFKKFPTVKTILPTRSDAQSAGYDFHSKERFVLHAGESHIFWTDVCATMFFDNVLHIYARSGLGCKHGIVPKNCVGVIDASYYHNPSNGGNIGVCLVNNGDTDITVEEGDKISQGVFSRYLITDDDGHHMSFLAGESSSKREGGFGSSGR